ncbi:hypothetical protein L596_010947 [Steinernema carpocapsae]|uniref:Uncharacterized protein n=1 Tax=Steinernema carpocapsae TaxID=34508 RepID=A0A4U5PK50_STECR|nr:hypothetical protein L596_010947 [Steinernema carpocapsae]
MRPFKTSFRKSRGTVAWLTWLLPGECHYLFNFKNIKEFSIPDGVEKQIAELFLEDEVKKSPTLVQLPENPPYLEEPGLETPTEAPKQAL